MKTLYFDLGMGAAGDMLSAALLELCPEPADIIEKLNSLDIPGVEYVNESVKKCGIGGTHMSVRVYGEEEDPHEGHDHEHHHEDHDHEHGHEDHHEDHDHEGHDHEHHHEGHDHEHHHEDHDHEHGHEHHHEGHDQEHGHEGHHEGHDQEHGHEGHHSHTHGHHHSSMHDIEHIVGDHLNIPDKVKQDVMAVYRIIAEAESRVHGVPVKDIHFHEVGTLDAIADITAVCFILNELAPEQIIASPVHVGSGHVRCAHGILPVPAPATANILTGVPIYGGKIQGELCTPTGAALLKHFVTKFGDMPVMTVKAIGYGMGKKDFETANCVRAILGETEDARDSIYELSCNIDDMTGEKIGFALERLLEAGARDAYTIPIGMKKSRPGILISALCQENEKQAVVEAFFKYTTTLGIREKKMNRYILDRDIEEISSPYGVIHKKNVNGYGVKRSKYEYEDLARAALVNRLSISEIEDEIKHLQDDVGKEN